MLLVVGIRIMLLYEHKTDVSWLRDLFVPIIVPILALTAFLLVYIILLETNKL